MRKAQAAMEYLMVFGFGIAAVLIVVGTLAYFGVINPSKFMPERCVIGVGFRCVDFFIRETTLMMKVENTLPKDVTIKRLELVSSSLANGRCNSDASTLLKPLATTEIQIPGCAFTTTGKNFAKLNVLYTGGQITHSLGGEIILQVANAYSGSLASVVGTTPTPNGLDLIDMRKIARDSQGNIYVTYTFQGPPHQIYINKSADGGKTWPGITKFAIADCTTDFSSIAVDSNDVVHLVYGDSTGAERIKYRNSLDGYAGYHSITTESELQKNPQISIGKDGTTLYVVWQGYTSAGITYIRFAKSVDNGNTWTKVDVPNQNGDADAYPTMVETTSGTLYIVARSRRATAPLTHNIQWTKSTDGGAHWDNFLQVSSSATAQQSPSLVIDSSNNLHVIWIEGNFIKYSKFDGSTWSIPTLPENTITTGGGTPASASLTIDSADNLYATWAEGTTIYTSKKLWGGSGWLTMPVQKITTGPSSKPTYRYSRYTARGALDMVYLNDTVTGVPRYQVLFSTDSFG